MKSSVNTCCPYCGVGCGVTANTDNSGGITITGDIKHPANAGRLCSKGSDLASTLSANQRLLHPMVKGEQSNWDTALDLVSSSLQHTLENYGPDAIAFYVSGQLLTEDYYVVNKFVKGFLGTANIDTNSRLCMASSVAGHKRAFGSDTVPGCYQDIEQADLVVLTGSNMAWCHPVLFQRLMSAKASRPSMKIVVIDPRRTATAELADQHLAINPGSDAVLFSGLLRYLDQQSALDQHYIDNYTDSFDDCINAALPASVDCVCDETGLSIEDLLAFYQLFVKTPKVVTVYSQGINQSESGTDSVNSIINCHLATGRIGKVGSGPFSITGQPNAMGGREVGGLSNMLAAHMELSNESHRQLVQEFWQSPHIAATPGLKAVDLFQAIAQKKIRFVWIMATNPVDSLPMANSVRLALRQCPFVVVSDVVEKTDTSEYATVLLPAAAWGEKNGTVTNSERCISRQRAFRKPLGEARPDWWQVAQVAQRLGFENAFNYPGPSEIFREHASLSAYRNAGDRDFDIGAYRTVTEQQYDQLQPFYWPATDSIDSIDHGEQKRFFSEGAFYTTNRRADFVAVKFPRTQRVNSDFPMILNTGRVRDQWHTMTRTGFSARLSAHLAEPFAEINPLDAKRVGIETAELVQVSSINSSIRVRALITDRQRVGSVFVPIHWSDQFASQARVDTLVSPITDPVSGQPASKSEPVAITRSRVSTYGFTVSKQPMNLPSDWAYWAATPCNDGWRVEFASEDEPRIERDRCRALFSGIETEQGQMIEYEDSVAGNYCSALFAGEKLIAAVYLARTPVAVSRVWASSQLGMSHTMQERAKLMAGIAPANRPDPGAIVCSCFMVGSNDIIRAIRESACHSVESLGDQLGAGTNCGSCRSELGSLLKRYHSSNSVLKPTEANTPVPA